MPDEIDELLAAEEKVKAKGEKTANASPAYEGIPPSSNELELFLNKLFPSTKANKGSGSGNVVKDVLRYGAEGVTYPARFAGAGLNYILGYPRGGDYGISDTMEESRKGYKEYDVPILGKVSPTGFTQEILHDPVNAAGGFIKKGISMGAAVIEKKLAEQAAKHAAKKTAERIVETGLQGAGQEAVRPLIMETDGDALDYLEQIIKGGAGGIAMGLGKEASSILGKKAIEKFLGRNLSPQQYTALLDQLARKNSPEPKKMAAALEAASTPEGRANIAKNHDKFNEIAGDILDYKTFDESKFPEHKAFQEWLERSVEKGETKVAPKDVEAVLTTHAKQIKEKAGGGGLTSEEELAAGRLKREAEILYDKPETPDAEMPVLFGADGKKVQIKNESPVREMNAAQLNDARQRIGSLLDDDWKRMEAGRPDAEVKALKSAYGMMKKHIMDIAEKEGETEAVKAYDAMANKLGTREALFDRLGVSSNKYKAHDGLREKLKRTNLEEESDLKDFFGNFDKAFGTNFSEQLRYAKHGQTLGAQVGPKGNLILPKDNQGKTGKFYQLMFEKLFARRTGSTIEGAVKRLETAKKPGIAMGLPKELQNLRTPPIYLRPESNQKEKN
ncbi:MAG: hypothetical protein LBC75_02645 [Fibromonadaceae bacterium]|jgi:hypothetical protein|nr:hypothetical protein [Fibromonadaceae bacterium]